MPKSNAQDQRSSAVARGQAVRTRLLDAAAELIGEVGWNAVSTRYLAERAGVGPGLVHYHFESLPVLLRQAALTQLRLVLDQVDEALAAGDLGEGIQAMLTELDHYSGGDRSSLLAIEAYLAATRDRQLHTEIAELMLGWRARLAAQLATTGHPDPEAGAALLLAVLDGLVLQKGLDPELRLTAVAPLLRQLVEPANPPGGNR